MKKIFFALVVIMFLIGLLGGCVKPDVSANGTTITTPPSQEDNKEEEGGEEEEVPLPPPVLSAVKTSFSNKAVYDQELILEGSNFSLKENGNVIMFDDERCTDILEATETEIVARVPRIKDKESVQLRVSTDGGTSNSLTIDFDLRRCDSVVLFTGARVEELRPGVKWTSTITTWKGEPRSINVVKIPKSEIKNLHFTYPSGKKTTSAQCKEVDALLGVNGQYFDNSSGGTGLARDFLKIDGVVKTNGADNRGDTYVSGAFVFDETSADIVKVSRNEGARKLTDKNVMACGPQLINDGTYRSLDLSSSHNTEPHPRTAVGVSEDGSVFLVTIDGRFPDKAVGMPTPDMQEFFTILGAVSALNLDGGGSTTMYIRGTGIVNHPSDGSWDAQQERAVNSIIYLK